MTTLQELKFDLLKLKAQFLLAKGNWGHKGRPGVVGGSGRGGGGGGSDSLTSSINAVVDKLEIARSIKEDKDNKNIRDGFKEVLIKEYGAKIGEQMVKADNDILINWGINSSFSEGALMKDYGERKGQANPTIYHWEFLDSDKKKVEKYKADVEEGRKNYKQKYPSVDIDLLLDARYKYNQAVLNKIYPSGTITLYRGVYSQSKGTQNKTLSQVGSKGTMAFNSISSFSSSKTTAKKFAGSKGTVYKTEVPVKDIYTSYHTTSYIRFEEKEFLVFGKPLKYEVV